MCIILVVPWEHINNLTCLLITGILSISHYFIDRYSLANYFLKWKGDIPFKEIPDMKLDDEKTRCVYVSFSSVLYIINDNLFHLYIMLGGLMLLQYLGIWKP